MKYLVVLFSVSLLLVTCTNQQGRPEQTSKVSDGDSQAMMRNFLSGLWSLDEKNSLNNEGFLILPDGTLNLVASENSGTWEVRGKDTIIFRFSAFDPRAQEQVSKIDSLSADRMVLRDEDGMHVFRKVPFGVNEEGMVLSGFMGSISPGMQKEYSFDLPAAKKIAVTLTCDEPAVSFRLFDSNKELTSAEIKKWDGIVIRGGKYKIQVIHKGKKSMKEEDVDFNLKVIGY